MLPAPEEGKLFQGAGCIWFKDTPTIFSKNRCSRHLGMSSCERSLRNATLSPSWFVLGYIAGNLLKKRLGCATIGTPTVGVQPINIVMSACTFICLLPEPHLGDHVKLSSENLVSTIMPRSFWFSQRSFLMTNQGLLWMLEEDKNPSVITWAFWRIWSVCQSLICSVTTTMPLSCRAPMLVMEGRKGGRWWTGHPLNFKLLVCQSSTGRNQSMAVDPRRYAAQLSSVTVDRSSQP